MTLFCGDGLIAYTILDEPELAMPDWFSFVIDGTDHRISDYELMNRDNARTRVFLKIPDSVALRLRDARTIGREYIHRAERVWDSSRRSVMSVCAR